MAARPAVVGYSVRHVRESRTVSDAESGGPAEGAGSIDALLAAALVEVRDRRPREAMRLLELCGPRLEAEGVPPEDSRRGEHAGLTGHCLRLQGEADRAIAVLDELVGRASRYGWYGSASRAAVQLGWLTRARGDLPGAERWMRESVRFSERSSGLEAILGSCGLAEILSMNGDPGGAERALAVAEERAGGREERFRVEITRATVADRHGRPDEADRALRVAARLASGGAAAYEVALQQAKLSLGRGEDQAALKYARRAVKAASDWGSPLVLAGARMLVGEVSRTLGRHDEADKAYRAAGELYGDNLSGRIARLNRAQNELARARYGPAAAHATAVRDAFPGNPIAEAVCGACLVPDAAGRGEWDRVAELVTEIVGRVVASGIVHKDIATSCTQAADVVMREGDVESAVRLVSVAHDGWRRLGNPEQLAAAAARLAELRAAGAPIPLRGFLLDRVIGEGASGTVWRARHAASGEQVAVKVLRGGASVTATVRSMFARELRAVAGLDHPNVVWLVDHGWVDDAAAIVDPRLEPDAPFLALEYASEGTLDARCGQMSWDEIRLVLVAVLDALAHAHARGLLHLDLKPTNVLLAGTPEGWVPKLADFGLARAPAPGRQLRATGTPAYMAPEQFGADAGALGPWTDLYALGCVITALLTGSPPFGLRGAAELRDAHLNRPPPPLVPLTGVPDGVYGFVARLLAKAPAQRFRSAAEAARALSALGEPCEPDRPPLVRDEPTASPFPDQWDERAIAPRDRGLVAAGLGLVSLRRPRTVGREAERTRLWELLRDDVERVSGTSVILTGPTGAGARHLVRWLAERAHELGAARGLMIGAEHGLPAGLSGPDDESVRLELERIASTRPLVIGLLHADGIAGAERVLRVAPTCRAAVSCLATATPSAARALALRTGGAVQVWRLPPLAIPVMRELASSLLPLDPELADRLCERARGTPGAVVQMLRRLAEDRQLVPAPGGWVLRPSADLDVVLGGPVRTREHLEALRAPDRTALQVLVGQGGTAELPAWEDACRAAGIADPGSSLERLARHGWIDPEGRSIRVADGVSEALARHLAVQRTVVPGRGAAGQG